MDTKRLQQHDAGSDAALDNKMNNGTSAKEKVVRHMDWRLGSTRMNENATSSSDCSDPDNFLEEEGLLQIEEVDGTLTVSGDLDLHQASVFLKEAERHINANSRPRLDLSRVPFLDSAGLATLLALSRFAKEQNKSIRVIATGSPRRVLKITGIDRVLLLED
jgi:anti-anti-sigma factor